MTLPRIIILEALKRHLRANVPLDPADPSRQLFKVRHERFRESTLEEMPCVAIRYLGDDSPDVTRGTDDPSRMSLAETVMELRVELIVDTPIAAESDRDTAGDPDDGDDDTGMEFASRIVEICLGALFTAGQETETMGGVIWDARYDGTGDNDDVSSPDNVRLAERLTLVYRARAEAPHQLLVGE
ncbi:MAG: hypothetical protein V4696_03685 [Pseudomonadota bacterium]